MKKLILLYTFLGLIGINQLKSQCLAPATLSSGNLTYYSANIIWAGVSGASSYDIRYRVFGTTTWITLNNVNSPYVLSGLQSSTKYQYSVRAVCNGINGTYSAIKLFTTLVAPCNLPTNLQATNITSGSAQLSWQNNSNGILNLISYRIQGAQSWTLDSTAGNSINLQNLNPQSTYEWRVQQKCSPTNFSPVTGTQNFITLAPAGVCPSVSNLSVSGITSSLANLQWDPNPNAIGFEINYRIAGSSTWQQTNSSNNSILLTNLLAQNQYEVNVKSLCASGTDANGSSVIFSTLGNDCVSAINANVSNITTVSAQINWTAGWNDNYYSVLYRKAGITAWDSVSSVTPNLNLTGLQSGVGYEYYVRTFCNTGASVRNNASIFYTLSSSCGIPAGLNYNNLTYQSANIYWTPLTGAFSYELRYRIFGTSVWITVPVTGTNYLLTGLLPFTKYQYSVRAVCSGLTGTYSAIKLFTTLLAPCLAPVNLTSQSISEHGAQLNWTPQNSGIGFRVQFRSSGSSLWISDSTITNTYTLGNLMANTGYECRVLQKCSSTTNSNYSNIHSFQTLPPACPPVAGLNVSNINFQGAYLQWNNEPNSIGYSLLYKKTSDTFYDTLFVLNNNYSLNNLEPLNSYEVKLKNTCATGTDTVYSSLFFTTSANPCGPVTDLALSNLGSSSAQINWNPQPNSVSYSVLLKKSGILNWDTLQTTNNLISLSNLQPATQYEYSIINHCSSGIPVNTVIQNFTTLDTVLILVPANSSWKYLDNGTDQGTSWRTSGFNDSGWATGNSELGYGDGGEATVVSFGPNSSSKYITTYFRKTFSADHLASMTNLKLKVVRDDGIVVYLNGSEVLRNNMPSGNILYNTLATAAISGADESAFNSFNIPLSNLISGQNTLAVEIHQNVVTSSDISFNLELTASTIAPVPVITIGPYIQMVNNTSAVILWETDLPGISEIYFGTQLGQLPNQITDTISTNKHEVKITGLNPFTKYYYGVSNGIYNLQSGEDNYFFTAPNEGDNQAFKVWITGDFGNGSNNQDLVRNSFVNYTGANPAHLWIWLGDNAYGSGLVSEYTSNVFGKYPGLLKKLPVFPAVGNHDYANVGYLSTSALGTNFPYFNYFKMPASGECGGVSSNTEKYYSYNYGNVHFISLDSYGASTSIGGAMYNWLLSDLQANQQKWIVCYWHHPPYSMGTHNSDTETEMINMRQNIIPLLESFNVDLVLNGHSHTYERSYGIHGHYGLESTFNNSMITLAGNGFPAFNKDNGNIGTVYAVCGVSGQGGSVSVQGNWPHAAMYTSENSKLGSMIMDVAGDSLKLIFLNSTGVISDRFNFYKPDLARASIKDAVLSDESELSISPNPGKEQFRVQCRNIEETIKKIRIISLDGKIIQNWENPVNNNSNSTLFVSDDLKPGIYYMEVLTNEKVYSRKLLISK